MGITTKRLFKKRMQAHRRPSSTCRYVSRAIQKYGWENFEVQTREVPVSTLNREEQKQIKELNCMAPKGYNLTSGGERTVHSDESKQKKSVSLKKTLSDPAKRARMSTAAKKAWKDQERWEKMIKKVVVTSLLTNKATTYTSQGAAIEATGFCDHTIASCCNARQIATGEYSIRYVKESPELKAKHEDMLKILTDTPCDVQTRSGRHLRSFSSAVEAVRWLRDKKQFKPKFWSAYKALTGLSKGFYGEKNRQVRIVRKNTGLDNFVTRNK